MNKKDLIEKAVDRPVGTVHPNGKWVWTEYKPGKFDWRGIKKNKPQASSDSSASTKTIPSKPTQAQITNYKVNSGKPMDSQQLAIWAQSTSDNNLLKVANNQNGKAQMRKIAYDALKQRGFDMSKVNTSGTLDSLLKMIGGNQKATVGNTNSNASVDIDDNSDGGVSDDKITENWYLDKEDFRVKKMFNLKTKEGRIKYDKFVFQKKKKEKDYKNPVEVVQDLYEQYLEFLDNDEQRFMISAGGAGVGKSYGFFKMAELLNLKPFDADKDAPGDDDYDVFEAPDVNSGKQLLNILKAHNGKIILFDDNDKVLTRSDCASVMKKATATTGKRIVGDPDDIKKNFEFTGRIMIMTNKDLSSLSEDEDTKAIISRAMMVSEIHLTIPETIEVMKSRYQEYEFPQAPRLSDDKEDKKEREEIMKLIEDNMSNIDPAQFTTRTFQEILTNKRKVDRANEKRNNPAFASLIGSKQKDWKEVAKSILTKAVMSDINEFDEKEFISKADENTLKKYYRATDDGVNYDDDEEFDSVEKAEEFLFKSEFSEEEREKLAKEDKAMPDGSFPIENVKDLKNAIKSWGRAKDPEKAKEWIKKRASELGKESILPETWKAEMDLDICGLDNNDLQKAEDILFG